MKLPCAETGMLPDGCGAKASVAGRYASVAGIRRGSFQYHAHARTASTKAKEASRMRPARLFGQENEMDSLSLLLPLLNS